MIVDCISDLHGHYPPLEGGDLLIVAGDLTRSDQPYQYEFLYDILQEKQYQKIVIIAGNHDGCLESGKVEFVEDSKIDYLCDSGTEFTYYPNLEKDMPDGTVIERKTFKIWGSPWTKTFEGINPRCKAFTCDTEEELAEKWALIPDDTDILVTHSPRFGMLDKTFECEYVGSKSLADRMIELRNVKYHIVGHIHEGYGQCHDACMKKNGIMTGLGCITVNASHVNENYKPVNKPIRIIL